MNEHDKHEIPEARLGYFRKKKDDCHAKVILREISTGLSEPLILKIARNGSFETKCHVSRRCSCCLFMFVCVFVYDGRCLCVFVFASASNVCINVREPPCSHMFVYVHVRAVVWRTADTGENLLLGSSTAH